MYYMKRCVILATTVHNAQRIIIIIIVIKVWSCLNHWKATTSPSLRKLHSIELLIWLRVQVSGKENVVNKKIKGKKFQEYCLNKSRVHRNKKTRPIF